MPEKISIHDWKEPSLSVGYDFWPEFHCHGITEGPTEQQYLQGARPAMAVNTEESADDAMRRYAGQIERLKNFINDKTNHIDADKWGETPAIRVEDIRKILEEEEEE
jgi:hypothetical protein